MPPERIGLLEQQSALRFEVVVHPQVRKVLIDGVPVECPTGLRFTGCPKAFSREMVAPRAAPEEFNDRNEKSLSRYLWPRPSSWSLCRKGRPDNFQVPWEMQRSRRSWTAFRLWNTKMSYSTALPGTGAKGSHHGAVPACDARSSRSRLVSSRSPPPQSLWYSRTPRALFPSNFEPVLSRCKCCRRPALQAFPCMYAMTQVTKVSTERGVVLFSKSMRDILGSAAYLSLHSSACWRLNIFAFGGCV
jgi:hypothetical protein